MTHAARKIGAVAVPLNYRLSPDEAAYVIDNSDAEVVYVDAEFADLITGVRARTPKVRRRPGLRRRRRARARAGRASPTPTRRSPDDRAGGATMIYTSGTTGKPKGALRTAAPTWPRRPA